MTDDGQVSAMLDALPDATDVLDALPDAVAVLDAAGYIVAVNHAWRMFALDNDGSPAATGVGVNYLDVCARAAAAGSEDARAAAAGLRAVLAGQTVESELEYPCPSPAANRWFLLRMTPLGGPVPGAVMSHVNITRRKMAEQAAAWQAAHDPLTGLANRELLTERISAALTGRGGRAVGRTVGVLYLDLDRFRQINDTYGHDAGDEVLLTTAYRLRGEAGPQDCVARLGGAEFAIAVPGVTADGLAALAERITGALAEPHLIHGNSIRIPTNVGTHLAAPGEQVRNALQHWDAGMYTVKRARAAAKVVVSG
jgi:diguanylate cyclase (GGDEF)-like protein